MGDPEPLQSDILFGGLVVEQGLATKEQVEECLSTLRQLFADGVTPLPKLADLLRRRGYLSAGAYEVTVQAPSGNSVAAVREGALPAEAATAALEASNVFGKYIRVRKLGAGGMGEVWRAWDRELRRWVALKLLRGQDAGEVARFEREAQTAAKLSHPNIAAVFGVGGLDGQPYIAMQLVEGQTLSTFPRDDRGALVDLLRDAALAVQYAHDRGIVHRDLKPANIMVEDGPRVFVMDFGLAKQSALDSSLSAAGAVLGTPAYMPPEQARGQVHLADARSDVYSLGATLYELLADRPPFQDRDVYAILKKVVDEEPPPLRKLNPRLAADLETIVMRCLEKDPARRYGSARELAEELGRWRAGEPILAHPPSVLYRARKWASKRKAALLPTAAALLLGAAFGVWSLGRSAEKDRARVATEEAVGLIEAGRPALDQAFRYLYGKEAVYEELVRRVEKGQGLIERALEKAPRMASAHYLLGRAWELRGWDDRAEASLRKAAELDPGFGPARYQLGRLLLSRSLLLRFGATKRVRERREKEAVRLAEEAAREFDAARGRSVFDDRLQAAVAEGWGAFARRDRVEMERVALEGIREHGAAEGVEEFHVLHAFSLPQDEQGPAWDRAIALRPKHALALFCRGAVRSPEWREKSIADYTEALRIHPRLQMAWINRGDARSERGDLDGAIADFGEALAIDPRDPLPYVNRASVRLEKGDFDLAISDCDAALRADPGYLLAWTVKGSARHGKGDGKAALADFAEGLKLDPLHAELLNDRSLVRQAMGDLEGAKADVEAVIRAHPDYVEAWINRGIQRLRRGDLQGAVADFSRAIELEPHRAIAWSNRGSAWEELGEHAKAVADCTRALELDPRDLSAWHNRGLARQQAGDLDGAIEDATAALRLKADDAEAHFNRGNAWEEKRQYKKALEDYDATIRLSPRYPEAYANRAALRMKLFDRAGALTDFRKALEVAPPDWAGRGDVERVIRQLGGR